MFGLAFLVLGFRMSALALVPPEEGRERVPVADIPERTQILDRNGRVMASTLPTWAVALRPRMAARQGQYSVIGLDGRILRRGHDLRVVLRVLERKLIRAVE